MENIPTNPTEKPAVESPEETEDAFWNGRRYNVEKLYQFAESIPTETVPLEHFEDVSSEENDTWWIGNDGSKIKATTVVKEWEKYKDDPNWSRHTDSLKFASLDNPILVSHDGHVLDGQHRIMRAFIEGKMEIKIKRLPENIPGEAELPYTY